MPYVMLKEVEWDSPTPPVCAHDTLEAAINCWRARGSHLFQEIWEVNETNAYMVWPMQT